MLARCEKLDLCQNVFVDGKWGAYRSALTPGPWRRTCMLCCSILIADRFMQSIAHFRMPGSPWEVP